MTLPDDALVLLGWSCPYCGNPTELVDSSEIYGQAYGGMCYYCVPCQAWVGCHKDSTKSLGRLADKNLRKLKHLAHEAFDPIWKDGYMSRSEAYLMLSRAFELPIGQTHIGMFNEELCRETIKFCKTVLIKIKNNNGKKN